MNVRLTCLRHLVVRQLFPLHELGFILAKILVPVCLFINECILLTPFPLARRMIRVRLSSIVVSDVIVSPRSIVFSDFLAISITGCVGLTFTVLVFDRCMDV